MCESLTVYQWLMNRSILINITFMKFHGHDTFELELITYCIPNIRLLQNLKRIHGLYFCLDLWMPGEPFPPDTRT